MWGHLTPYSFLCYSKISGSITSSYTVKCQNFVEFLPIALCRILEGGADLHSTEDGLLLKAYASMLSYFSRV